MKLLLRNKYYEKAILLKQKMQKILKHIVGNDDDPFGNSCVIL